MYGLDFSMFRRDMRLADVADEVKAQNVHWGSFEEILKTTDPNITVEQFGRRFMTERILVAGGTPKQIVDKLEQWHFETGANGGFMLARGFSAPGNLQEFVDLVVPELQRRGLSKKKYAGATLRETCCTDVCARRLRIARNPPAIFASGPRPRPPRDRSANPPQWQRRALPACCRPDRR